MMSRKGERCNLVSINIPKMKLEKVTVKEGEKTIWRNGSYLEGIAGITGASENDEYVTFNIGSNPHPFEIGRE